MEKPPQQQLYVNRIGVSARPPHWSDIPRELRRRICELWWREENRPWTLVFSVPEKAESHYNYNRAIILENKVICRVSHQIDYTYALCLAKSRWRTALAVVQALPL